MDGNPFPTFEQRTAWLAETTRLLNQIIRVNLGPDMTERAVALRARVRACAAPYDADLDEEMAAHRDAVGLQDEIHRATNYRTFIRRLEETDTRNLVACYLPERSWVQDLLRGPSCVVGGCELCREWATSGGQARDCGFLGMPPAVFFGCCMGERWDFCRWVQELVVGLAMFPQPPARMDDYVARVAEYSRTHGPGDNVWTHDRILSTAREAQWRAEGRQLNCRQFLRTGGWQDTLARIEHDWATAAARVRAFLAPDRSAELGEAIHYDARMYYVRSFGFAARRCVDQRPRRWVLDYLRTHPPPPLPPAPGPRGGVRWGRILTADRVWPVFHVDARLDVWAGIRFVETGGGRVGAACWEMRWLGRLDAGAPELAARVCANVRDERALSKTVRWMEELELEREAERAEDVDRGSEVDLYEADEEGGASEGEVGSGRSGDGDGDGSKPPAAAGCSHGKGAEDGCSRAGSEGEGDRETTDCGLSSADEECVSVVGPVCGRGSRGVKT